MSFPAACASAPSSPWRSPAVRVLVIADEPTTALDVTIQAQVLDLLAEMRREMGLAMLYITHDLDVVADFCDRAVIIYSGDMVEDGAAQRLPEASAPSLYARASSTRFRARWQDGARLSRHPRNRCRRSAPGRPAADLRRAAIGPRRSAATARRLTRDGRSARCWRPLPEAAR